MNKVMGIFRRMRLRQILTVFLAGLLLIVGTACSSANSTGANPNNPAVQAGGANNPYKSGGDGYTNYNMSTDTKANNAAKSGREHANLPFDSLQLVAASEPEILYPGAETPAGRAEKEAQLPIKTSEDFKRPASGGLIQRDPDLGDRVEQRIEKVQEAFKEATEFVGDKAEEASKRPEATSNPALRRK